MPRCARSSARCGPTPLIMRTSVPRFIVIGEREGNTTNRKRARKAGDRIFFISFPPRTYRKGRNLRPGIPTDRVSVPYPKRGGSCGGRPSDRFRQARAAALGGGGHSRRAVRLQVFLP